MVGFSVKNEGLLMFCWFLETLRKYPAAAFLGRRCTKDYKVEGTDVVLEKGCKLFIPVMGLHHDDEYFPEPEKFDPERFSDENKRHIKPFTYLPFGEGPRNCIGAFSGSYKVFGLVILFFCRCSFWFDANTSWFSVTAKRLQI